jgi:hypothetical protein
MSIKQFKISANRERKVCDLCSAITYDLGSIKVATRDPKRVYRNSNRAIICNYKIRVCEKCYKGIEKRIESFIYGNPKKT